jgi:hypothetical protein
MAYELCLATVGKQVPSGPDWIHEVKHDDYRMLEIRENDRVRLLSRKGTDWTKLLRLRDRVVFAACCPRCLRGAKARHREGGKHLQARFGKTYVNYAERVRRWI